MYFKRIKYFKITYVSFEKLEQSSSRQMLQAVARRHTEVAQAT